MARINVEDSVESKHQWKKLVRLLDGDEERAMGMLVFFWRHAQDLRARDQDVPQEVMDERGWGVLIQSGWAISRGAGYYAWGSSDRFAWYEQRVKSASAGGRARAHGPRDESGRFQPKPSVRVENLQPESSHAPAGIQPTSSPLSLAPSPSLSPALSKKKEGKAPIPHGLAPRQESSGRDLITEYVNAFRKRYGEKTRPEITGKTAGQVKNLLKSIPVERAKQLVQVYLQMDDRWFETKNHDFATFIENLTKIGVALDTGQKPGGVNWSGVFGDEERLPEKRP